MRTTRAYFAEFGTAGSILAGAAVLFVIGSALVAFRGWPKVANQGAPTALSVPSAGPASASRVSRRLRAVAKAGSARGAGQSKVSPSTRVAIPARRVSRGVSRDQRNLTKSAGALGREVSSGHTRQLQSLTPAAGQLLGPARHSTG